MVDAHNRRVETVRGIADSLVPAKQPVDA
jgi:hypothetical protein